MLNRCCCFRLQTGGMIIGWINVVGSLISLIIFSFLLANVDEIVQLIKQASDKNDAELPLEAIRLVFLTVLSVYLGLTCINLLSASLLLIGIVKERHLLIVPWLINSGISLVFTTLYIIGVICVSFDNGSGADIVSAFIFGGIVLGVSYYIWYAIHSLYRTIRDGGERQRLMPVYSATPPVNPSYNKI